MLFYFIFLIVTFWMLHHFFRYMKGRLTSLNVNVVIDSINAALVNKYDILRKSRNTLKKKDQDMYNTWKIEQNNVGQGI